MNTLRNSLDVLAQLFLTGFEAGVRLDLTDLGAMVHNLVLKAFKNILQVFKLQVELHHVEPGLWVGFHI